MRISLIGQAAFGADAVDALLAEGHEIVAVAAVEPEGGQIDPLWAKAEALGIPLIDTRQLARSEPDWLDQFQPDLGVMAFVTAILPERVLRAPTEGTIEYHPSLLPRHRGRSAINWALIQGDQVTGLTIFWVDRGVDTGPILLQEEVAIGPDDTMGSLYFERLYPMGLEALKESVRLVAAGNPPRIEQDESLATYEPPCEDEHAAIEWAAGANQTYNLVRGTNPRPGAHTAWQGRVLRIFDCALLPAPGKPGEVVKVQEDSFYIGVGDGTLQVLRVAPEGGRKINAGEWAAGVNLQPGDLLQ